MDFYNLFFSWSVSNWKPEKREASASADRAKGFKSVDEQKTTLLYGIAAIFRANPDLELNSQQD